MNEICFVQTQLIAFEGQLKRPYDAHGFAVVRFRIGNE